MQIEDEAFPTLVILPSPLIQAATYRQVARLISTRLRVLILEFPESGWNFSSSLTWTNEMYSQWVAEVLTRKGISKAILLGHSNSGAIAIDMAARNPHAIQALVLADTTGIEAQSALRTILARAFDGILEFKFSLSASLHLLFNLIFHPLNFIFQIKLSIFANLKSQIRKIKVPTFIAWGEKDHTMPLKLFQQLRRMLPFAQVYLSPRGSHDWILTNPHEFAEILIDWVERSLTAEILDQKSSHHS